MYFADHLSSISQNGSKCPFSTNYLAVTDKTKHNYNQTQENTKLANT